MPTSDPLASALDFLGSFHSHPFHRTSALHGLPLVDNRLTPELFLQAASRAGFSAKLITRPLHELHPSTLPAVLLLSGNEAAVLLEFPSPNQVRLRFPGEESDTLMPQAQIAGRYTGMAILLHPDQSPLDSRSADPPSPSREHWFWSTLWRFRGSYAQVLVATFVINLLALSSSLFMMNVYDRVVPNRATDTLWVLAIGVLLAYGFEFILRTLRTFFTDRAGHRIDLILGGELFARVLGMPFQRRPDSAGIIASQARSYESLREFFTSATIAALVDLPFVFVFAGVIFLLGGPVALPLVLGALLALLLGAVLQIPIAHAVGQTYRSGNQRQALFVEGIQALETIKATRSESQLQARLEQTVRLSSQAEGEARSYSQLALNGTALLQHLVSTAIIIVAYFRVAAEEMTMGAMIACVILASRAMAPMAMVASLLTRLQQSRRALQGLDQIMQSPQEQDPRATRYLSLSHFSPSLETRDLDFSFDPESEPVLRGLNLNIRPGERVAILGRVGCGKSTLLRILASLYEPSSGSLRFSGIDVRQIHPADLRRRIGYLPQDPVLLHGTIRANLQAGCPQASDDDLHRIIALAGLSSFIQSLPRGVDHPVAEGGRSLSGGQRQAILLARALLESPSLLILDEPTSAMDQASERHILHSLSAFLQAAPSRTLILATHKLSLLALVERVIILDRGRIVADGPKEEVLRPTPPPRSPSPGAPNPTPSPAPAQAGLAS